MHACCAPLDITTAVLAYCVMPLACAVLCCVPACHCQQCSNFLSSLSASHTMNLRVCLQPLMEAGLDSLGAVDLRSSLSAAFSLELPATVIFDYPTAAELARWLQSQLVRSSSPTMTLHATACSPCSQRPVSSSCLPISASNVQLQMPACKLSSV